MGNVLGLIAGNGRLPFIAAAAAKALGQRVVAVAHRNETSPDLASTVDVLEWVSVGQLGKIASLLRHHGVHRASMVGGIGRLSPWLNLRPDFGLLEMARQLQGFGDDALLRGIAQYLERRGIELVSVTQVLPKLLATQGHLAGPSLSAAQSRDVELGRKVAAQLGLADVGQTVVVKRGMVLAVEALEGTDACIRRGGLVGGPGAVVVKRSKPNQDTRFDLPAIGPLTLEVMREAGAQVLAVESGSTLLLDWNVAEPWARRLHISVLAF
jgi:UDP-2,3-diacylglucosamine hydrolase